jgi:coproporphyrinogen III oxidase-like Fe-S oxidoreductase
VRTTNLKPIDSWARSILAGIPPTASAETLTPRQRAGELVWLGIRRREGVDLAAAEQRLNLPVRQLFAATIGAQVRNGLVVDDGTHLRLTAAGLLVADRIGAAYLSPP